MIFIIIFLTCILRWLEKNSEKTVNNLNVIKPWQVKSELINRNPKSGLYSVQGKFYPR